MKEWGSEKLGYLPKVTKPIGRKTLGFNLKVHMSSQDPALFPESWAARHKETLRGRQCAVELKVGRECFYWSSESRLSGGGVFQTEA